MIENKRFIELLCEAFSRECVKKLVFSRPTSSEVSKISARTVAHRGRKMLACEYSLPGNTVSHKNLGEGEIADFVAELLKEYRQANLITPLGDVEWKISSSGKCVLLGEDKLKRKLEGQTPSFVSAIEALDKTKNYILKGDELFLIKLGISDKTGRVHDKKQGKFRQINRFLEYVEEVYSSLDADGELLVYDLCCGKSYLSFAVYYYLVEIKNRKVRMLGIDLKRDVIEWCSGLASSLGYNGMKFVCDDVNNTPSNVAPDLIISLHACDVATDIVINRAITLSCKVLLSTPCCHRYLNDKINNASLNFVARYPHLKGKLCEAITDSIRAARLEANGYAVTITELTDPDDTPKNTLIKAIKRGDSDDGAKERYQSILRFVLGDNCDNYLKDL